MIRPITLITALMAILSGLYLYYSKNAVLMLDRRIEKIARDTMTVGEQTRLLHAEWMLLNDPERLRQFSDRYLTLKPLTPTQFTTLADLAGRMPAPRMPEPEPAPQPNTQPATDVTANPQNAVTRTIMAADPIPTEEAAPAIVADEVLPMPPALVSPPPNFAPPPIIAAPVIATPAQPAPVIAAAQPRPAPTTQPAPARTEPRPPLQAQVAPTPETRPAPRQTEARSSETRPTETRVATTRPPLQGAVTTPAPTQIASAAPAVPRQPSTARPAAPSPAPVAQASAPRAPKPYAAPAAPRPAPAPSIYQPVSAPMGGSMLGGAQRGAPVPLPRPTPFGVPAFDGGG